jgi:hypothetical protein
MDGSESIEFTTPVTVEMLNLLVQVAILAAIDEVKQRQGGIAVDVAQAAAAAGLQAAVKACAAALLEELDEHAVAKARS